MKKLCTSLLYLILTISLSGNAFASTFSDLFSNLFKPAQPKVAPQAVFNASLEPYISQVAMKDENICAAPLADKDLKQMQYDQFLIHSLLDLHKVDESLPVSSVNLYMSVLLQKLRASVELDNPEDQTFLNKLNQTDFQVASFAMTSNAILKLGKLIAAHQSLELGSYSIDGYLKIAIDSYVKCSVKNTNCNGSEKLWSNWFEQNGFGLVDPLLNKEILQSNNLAEDEINKISSANFKISIPVGEYKSEELVKSVFELLNVYGGENFDYFSYMAGEKLESDQGSAGGVINAPGKIVGGLLLKLANQRIVAYYKYQRCRLLSQNNSNVSMVEKIFTATTNGTSPIKSSSSIVSYCPGGVCPKDTTAVTAGANPIAIANTSGINPSSPQSCNGQQIWLAASGKCFSCELGRKPNPTIDACVHDDSADPVAVANLHISYATAKCTEGQIANFGWNDGGRCITCNANRNLTSNPNRNICVPKNSTQAAPSLSPIAPATVTINEATTAATTENLHYPERFVCNGVSGCLRSGAPTGKLCNIQGYCISSNDLINFDRPVSRNKRGNERAEAMLCDKNATCMPMEDLDIYYRDNVTQSDCPAVTSTSCQGDVCIETMTKANINQLRECSLRVNNQKNWCNSADGLKAKSEVREKIPCLSPNSASGTVNSSATLQSSSAKHHLFIKYMTSTTPIGQMQEDQYQNLPREEAVKKCQSIYQSNNATYIQCKWNNEVIYSIGATPQAASPAPTPVTTPASASQIFNEACYLNRYRDVKDYVTANSQYSGKEHWDLHGKKEGRIPGCD